MLTEDLDTISDGLDSYEKKFPSILKEYFHHTITDGFDYYGDYYEEILPDTKLSTLDGPGSYEDFKLVSLKQMEDRYSESHFDQDDQEIHRLSRTTFGDYGQNVDTTSTQYKSHHNGLDTKILPHLTTSSMSLPPLHHYDSGLKSLAPPISYGNGQAMDTASVQHDAQVQDAASGEVFEKHSIREENSGNSIAKPSLLKYSGQVAVDNSLAHLCQDFFQRVQELVSSVSEMKYQGRADADSSMMYPCQGGIQGVQESGYPNSPIQSYGHDFVASSRMHLCQGDIQRVHALGDQENGEPYKNFVDKVEAPPSKNIEGNIHQSGVDDSDAMPYGPHGKSVKRSRHTPEDLLKLRNHYNNSSRNPNFAECLALSYGTNLDFKQVSTWFSNERERKRVRESGDSEEIISSSRKRHSDFQINLLKAWVAKNEPNDPAPSTKERKELARETGLSLEQVSGWFMNLRKNRKRKNLSSQ